MFHPVSIPFGCKMLFNEIKLKPGITLEQVEMALGEMCNVVKNTYGGKKGGFIAGQVYKFAGFVSAEGSVGPVGAAAGAADTPEHIVIVTYWNSFAEHEKSHADTVFNEKFAALAALCTESRELGYDMLWQGDPEPEDSAGA
jgi:hypothetical protein